mgnify:CR=1 FL=1
MNAEKKAEIQRLLEFYKLVGLPSTFKQLGLHNPTNEMLLTVAKRATIEGETMAHEPFLVSPDRVVDAMRCADCLGEKANGTSCLLC